MSRRNETRRSRSTRQPAPAPVQAAAGPLWAAVALGIAGVVLSLVLARVHAQAHAGIASFCSISDTVNCDRVATSRYSVVLGLPVAIWGVLGYALATALAGWGLRRRADSTAAAGLLLIVAVCAVAASIALALVSELAIGALCILCAASWVLTVVLLVTASRACRGPGARASVRSGVRALRVRPFRTAALVVAGVVVLAFAATAYPRYWERPRTEQAATAPAATTSPPPSIPDPVERGRAVADGGSPRAGGPVVVEYSDYECPFCARAHEETRAILKQRPDVTIVRRQFPLDASCNPALTRTIHPGACNLARAAICAEEQGKFGQMDDALFRNQREALPVVDVAKEVGLDPERLRACMTSPATQRRLEADIAAAIRENVRATPTYVVNGVSRAGQFPLDLLPPAPVSAR